MYLFCAKPQWILINRAIDQDSVSISTAFKEQMSACVSKPDIHLMLFRRAKIRALNAQLLSLISSCGFWGIKGGVYSFMININEICSLKLNPLIVCVFFAVISIFKFNQTHTVYLCLYRTASPKTQTDASKCSACSVTQLLLNTDANSESTKCKQWCLKQFVGHMNHFPLIHF